MSVGTIVTLKLQAGFGFIWQAGNSSKDIFFHMDDVADSLEWNQRLMQTRVEYEIENTSKGPRAVNIRPAPVAR